jgi:Domain of unknown function (DUF5666)
MICASAMFKGWSKGLARSCRVALVALPVIIMMACGGGGGGTASAPGTGGTGITATGPVAGFGSVIVNGIRFEDSQARVQIDGNAVQPNQLRLGMVANVAGIKSDAAITATSVVKALGSANTIDVWSIAQGSVTSVASAGTFSVAGMTMVTDAGTVFEGAMSSSGLTTQTMVRVWGQPISADFKQWSVTRLEVLDQASDTVSTGKIKLGTTHAYLNGIVLTDSPVTLKDGQLVRATGKLISSVTRSTLTVSKITSLEDIYNNANASGNAELQGVVTSVLGTSTTTPAKVTRLTIGTTVIDTSNATLSPAGATIVQGSRVEAEGSWNAGVLAARKIEVKSTQELQEVEIEGLIEQFVSVADFTVRGQRCDASGLTKVNTLRVGTKVHLHGLKTGDVVRVTELEIE